MGNCENYVRPPEDEKPPEITDVYQLGYQAGLADGLAQSTARLKRLDSVLTQAVGIATRLTWRGSANLREALRELKDLRDTEALVK